MNAFDINLKNFEATPKLNESQLSPNQKKLLRERLNQDPRMVDFLKKISLGFDFEKEDFLPVV